MTTIPTDARLRAMASQMLRAWPDHDGLGPIREMVRRSRTLGEVARARLEAHLASYPEHPPPHTPSPSEWQTTP